MWRGKCAWLWIWGRNFLTNRNILLIRRSLSCASGVTLWKHARFIIPRSHDLTNLARVPFRSLPLPMDIRLVHAVCHRKYKQNLYSFHPDMHCVPVSSGTSENRTQEGLFFVLIASSRCTWQRKVTKFCTFDQHAQILMCNFDFFFPR